MARSDRIMRRHLRQRFLITTKQGHTWRAVVTDLDDKSFALAHTEAVNADGTTTPADGQVFIHRADVAYMQLA